MTRSLLSALLVSLATSAFADGSVKLTREELGAVKKKLAAVAEAVGTPAGYAKDDEDYSLPTEVYETKGKFNPVSGGVSRRFVGASEKKGKKDAESMSVDYQKKMAEAQARGDFAEMSRLGMEMSQRSGTVQSEILTGMKKPLSVNISINTSVNETLDPEMIVVEKPGVIGVKRESGDDSLEVNLYFDPVALKDVKNLSSAELTLPEGVDKKVKVLNVQVTLQGAPAEVEAFAKKIDTAGILKQIDR